MKEWPNILASEYCYNVTDGTHDSPKPVTEGRYLITSKHIKNNEIDFASAYKISENDYQKIITRSGVNQWDIIISMIGAYCGFCYVESSKNTDYAIKNVGLFKVGEEIKCKWLYYYLTSPQGKQQLSMLRSGSTQPYIALNSLRNLLIPVPNSENMESIVKIMDSIDAKIRVNRQINDNLEQQLQSLYREWFIENPKADWTTVNLSEIASFTSGYSYKGNELVESSDTAMATIKNFERNGGFKIDGYKPIVPSAKLKIDQRAQLFDILVAHTDLTQNAEVIGNAEILLSKDIYKDLIFSMDLVKVNAKDSFPFQFLLALLLKNPRFKSHCIGYVNGTTVLHMNKRALPDYETIIPNSEDAQSLNATAKAIFCQMSENLTEILNLTKLRDTLLPKLMSGELKINEIDC